MGSDAGTFPPPSSESDEPARELTYPGFAGAGGEEGTVDGMRLPYSIVMRMLQSGAGEQCPNNDCGPRWNPNIVGERGARGAFEFFHAFGNGYSGWMTSYGYSHYEGSGRSFYNSAYDDYNENRSHLTQSNDSFFGHGPTPQKTTQSQKTPCNVQIPVGNLDQEALVYTLSHEVSPNGREKEARGIASAIWKFAYATFKREGTVQYGDIYNAVMYPKPDALRGQYIQDKKHHPDWTPRDWYKSGEDIVGKALATNNGDNACERLRAIVLAATTPGEGLPLNLQHWVGHGTWTSFKP
jgi:hypothetical protein